MRREFKNRLLAGMTTAVILATTITVSIEAMGHESLTDSYIKNEYQEYCFEIGEEYNVSPFLIMAMIEAESSGKADAVNDAGTCMGLMQINMSNSVGAGVDPYDPKQNIRAGVEILLRKAELVEGDDIGIALNLYNGQKVYDELTPYAEKILNRAYELESKYYAE